MVQEGRGLSFFSRAFRAKAISCERAHVDVSKLIASAAWSSKARSSSVRRIRNTFPRV